MKTKTRLKIFLALGLAFTSWGQIAQADGPSVGGKTHYTNLKAIQEPVLNLSEQAIIRGNQPGDKPSKTEKTEFTRAYINDFRVNSENYYSAFEQTQADLACSRWPMTAWAVWTDNRSPNNDIYLQRFDSLMNKAGNNIKVNDDTIQSRQLQPDVDCDSVGNAVVVWYDDRWPGGWGQRFDKNGNRLGANFRLRQDTVGLAIYYTAVAMVEGQGFVTVSSGYHSGFPNWVIMSQRFDINGNYRPHYYVDTTNSSKGRVVCGWGGQRIVYAWYDRRHGSWSIYARVYNLNDGSLGPSFRVTEPAAAIYDVDNWRPALAVGDTGQFCIAWQDYRNGNGDIYAQRFDRNGVPQGANFKVNQDAGTSYQGDPQAYYFKDGPYKRFLLITFSDQTSGRRIYGSMYNTAGGLVFSSPFVPADGYPEGNHCIGFTYRPATSSYIGPIAWDAYLSNYRDIYAKDVYSTAHAIKCHSDSMGANQTEPCLASDSLGHWIVLWADYRRPDKGSLIFGRGYNADGTPGTGEFLLSDTLKNDFAQSPCQAINPAGDYILAWSNYANITGAWGRIGGAPMSPNIRLSADTAYMKMLPAAALDNAGNFVLCWLDTRNSNYYDLYCRGFLAGALPVTATDVKVNPAGTTCINYAPKVLSLGGLRFAFLYIIDEGGTFALYCRLAELSGTAINFLGDHFRVSDNPAGVNLNYLGAAAGPTGDFIAGWYDYRQYNLMARWFNRDGNALGASFPVSGDFSYPQYINMGIDLRGRLSIVWQQWVAGNGGEVFARLYNTDRTPYTPVFRVNNDPTAYYQGKPATTGATGKFYFAWEDGRYDTCGTDIFAKGYTWEELGVAQGPGSELKVGSLKLLPNAPNPFSKFTKIKFQMPKSGLVSLKVYNAAGQVVRTLVSGYLAAGEHGVVWDGRDEQGRQAVAGVYYGQLITAEGRISHRMIKLR